MKNSINIHSGDLQIATADNVKINKDYISALNVSNTVSCVNWDSIPEWSPHSGTCPKCESHNIEINNMMVLTSNPPQSQLRCKDCGYYFSSGMFNSRNTNRDTLDDYWKSGHSILDIPKVGDWPPGPQVGDAPWWPSEQEPPSYPDISIPSKDSPTGWVCPKCGRSWAPHISGCSYCNTSEIKITY